MSHSSLHHGVDPGDRNPYIGCVLLPYQQDAGGPVSSLSPSASSSSRHFLLASDFDQTLSFNDSGLVLSELIGASSFEAKVAGLAASNLVQQGGELAYLIRHDPEFRGVRREHLVEAGRRVRLKGGLKTFVEFLERGVGGHRFSFFVVSAAPREVVVSALDGIVPEEN